MQHPRDGRAGETLIKFRILLTMSAVLVLGACNFFSQPADIQTENLQSELARTQIAGIRATATVNSERLAITAEFAQGAVQNAELQSTRIASTLIAAGVTFIDVPEVAVLLPTADPLLNAGGAPQQTFPAIQNPLLTPGSSGIVVTQGASARGDAIIVVPSPTPLVQQNTSGALQNIQVSTRVGADDCVISPSTTFTQGMTELYVSAAATIVAGTTLSARWVHDGTEVAFNEWTPDFNINGACIWFNILNSSIPLTAGAWSVQLAISGTPVGQPVSFTITA